MPRRMGWASRNLPWTMAAARWTGALIGRVVRPVIQGYAFAGAQVNRLTMDWILAPLTSADQEIKADLKTLVARSRELARNDPHFARYLGLREENVAGPVGIALQARIESADGTPDEAANKAIEAAWKEWGKPKNASVDGRLSWVEIQKLAARTEAQDGEFLARMVGGLRSNPFGFSIQVLDCDQLDRDFNRAQRGEENEVRMGVEVNGFGRPLAYHIFRSHPRDYQATRDQRQRVRIPASEIIHWYDQKRPGQTRGVPRSAPVLIDIRMRAGYQQAALVNARTAAAKGGFFEQDLDSAAVQDPNRPAGTQKRIQMEISPGVIDTLPPGLTFKAWDPTQPSGVYAPFNTSILQSFATGLQVSYHALTGDLSKVSFSSIRDGTLRDRDVYRSAHQSIIAHLHERVYERWLLWALTTGGLRLATRNPADWNAHEWQPRGWDWVDPLKDILTLEKEFELFVNSHPRACAERGRDFEQIIDDWVRTRQMMEKRGFALPGSGAGNSSALLKLSEMDDDDYEKLTPEGLMTLFGEARQGNGATHAHP